MMQWRKSIHHGVPVLKDRLRHGETGDPMQDNHDPPRTGEQSNGDLQPGFLGNPDRSSGA